MASRGLRELYEASTVDQLRSRLSDRLAHLGFWGVGESVNPKSPRHDGDHSLDQYTWDNYDIRLGDRRAEVLTAYHSAYAAQGREEEDRRLSWLAAQTHPYFSITNAPIRFEAHYERCRLVRDFGLRAADHLVLPLGPAPEGARRLWAVAETQGAVRDAEAALGSLVVYRHMSRVLARSDRRGEPSGPSSDGRVELKAPEREVLRWAAAGKTMSEISIILGMPYRTVRFHIEKARERYGFATTQQTIVRAAFDYGFDPMGGR